MWEKAMSDGLTAERILEFRENGVVVLRNVFSDWVDVLARGVDVNMNKPGPHGRVYPSETGGRFLSDYCNWQRIPEYKDFVENAPAGEIAAALMGASKAQLFHEHVLVKEASTDIPTPWHQDLPYYPVSCDKTCSLWIPLDPIPLDRSPTFVEGSHLWGKLYKPRRFNGDALNDEDGLELLPDIDAALEEDPDAYAIRAWEMQPGDAIAFDYRTIHGAPPNRSAGQSRRAFSLRLVGEGARFVRKDALTTSPPFPDVELADGDPLTGPEFPTLWRE